MTLPVVLCSTVVRGAAKGEEHGGLWVADFAFGELRRVLDHRDEVLDAAGRGGDRGLRGLVVLGDRVYVAASRGVLVFDPELRHVHTWTGPALDRIHAMVARDGLVWLVSTGFDAILALDPARGFVWGLRLGEDPTPFDPATPPPPSDRLHLNSIASWGGALYVSGLRTPWLTRIRDGAVEIVDELPLGTHDVLPGADGLLFHDTVRDRLVHRGADGERFLPVPRADRDRLRAWTADALARPDFARGLVRTADGHVVSGASPARVHAWDLARGEVLATLVATEDVRHAVQAIVEWPFD